MLGRLGAEGANYRALEYVGSGVSAMEIVDQSARPASKDRDQMQGCLRSAPSS
jgi:hypothetical protein